MAYTQDYLPRNGNWELWCKNASFPRAAHGCINENYPCTQGAVPTPGQE